MGRWSGKSCRLSTMMLMTSVFFLVEIIVGYVTNSIALVADSFHMLSDLVALVVGLASVKISKKFTKGNTYGWQRAEVLGALINCVFLLALCFSIMVESLKRMVELERVENPVMMLVVGGLGLLVNLLGLALFGGHGHSHGGGGHGHSHGGQGDGHGHGNGHIDNGKVDPGGHYENGTTFRNPVDEHKMILSGDLTGETKCLVDPVINAYATPVLDKAMPIGAKGNCVHANGNNKNNNNSDDNSVHEHDVYSISDGVHIDMEKSPSSESMNMRGVFLHVLGDALGSVVVIISGVAIWLVEGEWKYYLDPVLSMVLVVIILYTTIPLFRETAHILLQAVPQDICVEGITKQILEIEGVMGVHEFHIWQLSGKRIIASAHVHCRDMRDYMSMASKIKDIFHRAGIHSTTIQPEVIKCPGECTVCSIQCPELSGRKSCVENTCCRGKSPTT